jgi:hypothetical protein
MIWDPESEGFVPFMSQAVTGLTKAAWPHLWPWLATAGIFALTSEWRIG